MAKLIFLVVKPSGKGICRKCLLLYDLSCFEQNCIINRIELIIQGNLKTYSACSAFIVLVNSKVLGDMYCVKPLHLRCMIACICFGTCLDEMRCALHHMPHS